VAGFGGGDGGI